jgi:AhpC/TSA family
MRSRLLRLAALAALIITLPAAAFNFAPTGPKPVPELSFLDGEGDEVKLADFLGKLVVLNLWATWCAPCGARCHRSIACRLHMAAMTSK